jgi:hypothetical protein
LQGGEGDAAVGKESSTTEKATFSCIHEINTTFSTNEIVGNSLTLN